MGNHYKYSIYRTNRHFSINSLYNTQMDFNCLELFNGISDNFKFQISICRLGVTKIAEQEVTYFGEQPKLNYVYSISKNEWLSNKQ